MWDTVLVHDGVGDLPARRPVECNYEEDRVSPSTRITQAALLAVAAAVLAVAAAQLRDRRQTAELTVENIHEQLDALDPVTRAAVIARLSSDEVKKVRDQHG